jgi:hypothetical protein
MSEQDAAMVKMALLETWLNPSKATVQGMKRLLQDLGTARANGHFTMPLYDIYEDMLCNWIAAREKRGMS